MFPQRKDILKQELRIVNEFKRCGMLSMKFQVKRKNIPQNKQIHV